MGVFPGSEFLWEFTLKHSPMGMALVSTEARIIAANEALCEILGRSEEELLTLRPYDVTLFSDQFVDRAEVMEAWEGKRTSYRVEKRLVRPDGTVVWTDCAVALLRTPDGTPMYFVIQVLDVTERHRAAEELSETNALLAQERRTSEAVNQSTDVGLLLVDAQGRFVRNNPRHMQLLALAYPGEDFTGVSQHQGFVYDADGVTPLDPEHVPVTRATAGEEFDDVRMWVGKDPKTRRALSVSARSVRNEKGEFDGAALAFKDVTDLVRAMEVKDQFVSSVSHELRTPLTSVLGHLEILTEETDLPEPTMGQLKVVQRNAARLQWLVSDLLDVAQMSSSFHVAHGEVDLSRVVGDAVEAALPVADGNGVSLRKEIAPGLATHGDPARLRQVVDNLLGNAVKYTDAGGEVTVSLAEEGGSLRLQVADTGIGIEPKDLESLFVRFFRGREALERQIPGTGLGLNIADAIVTAHGGSVGVQSEPGRGSTFTVTLPVCGDAAASAPAPG